MSSCQVSNQYYMSKNITAGLSSPLALHIVDQVCRCCPCSLSWSWRSQSSTRSSREPRLDQDSFASEASGLLLLRLHYEYCTCHVTASCNCLDVTIFVWILRDKTNLNAVFVVAVVTLPPPWCSLTEVTSERYENSGPWQEQAQAPCWTVMAPYVINNTTALLNSPPATSGVENNTFNGVALVPLGENSHKADSDSGVTNLPYSLHPLPTKMAPSTTVAVKFHEEERTATGIPISLIWMPYVALTLIIVGLMMASFWKYHKKHGHKYVRRREELAKKHQQALKQMQAQAAAAEQNQVGHHPPGVKEGAGHAKKSRSTGQGGTLPPNGGPSSIEDPSSSRYRHQNQTSTGASKSRSSANKAPSTSRQRSNPSGSTPSKSKSHQQHATAPNTRTPSTGANNGNKNAPRNPNKRHHKPLTFTKNENGSMVDLRVEEKNKGGSTKMFKQPFQSHKPLSPWTVPPRPGEYSTLPTTLHSPSSPVGFSDDDDDHSYLIHQTKL